MYYVYVLRSLKDGDLYSGYTSDLRQRVKAHNSGDVESTKHRKPFKLIYYEAYLHQQDATSREVFQNSVGKKLYTSFAVVIPTEAKSDLAKWRDLFQQALECVRFLDSLRSLGMTGSAKLVLY